MLRFIRKYNKYILAVFGTLLLITFLVPYAITQIGSASSRGGIKWATIGPDDETLKSTVRVQASRELQLLQNLQLQVGPFGVMDQPSHWYLLVKEAREAGLVGNLTPASLGQMQFGNQDPQFVANTYAKLAAVTSLIQLHLDGTPFSTSGVDSGRLSDRRVRHIAKERYHNVSVQMVMIKAAAPENAGSFTEAQLQEQFDEYKDFLPGEGEMGFGYKLPNRLKLEWLEISISSVKKMIESSDALNAVALRKHWRKNDAQFGPPIANAEVPQDVYDDLLQTLTDAKLKEISRFGHNQLRRKQRGLKQENSAFVIPTDWQGLSFVDLAQKIQNDFGVSLPAYHAAGSRWLWTGEISDLQGLSEATTVRFGQIPMNLFDLVSTLREFNADSTIPVQSQISGPPLDGINGNIYFFRVTDVDPSRAPNSLDEANDAVIADLGRIQEYQHLIQSMDEVQQQARNEGLLAVALENNSVVDQRRLLSIGSSIVLPEIGQNSDLIKTIVDRARELPTNIAFDNLTDDQTTFVLPVDDSLVLLVVKLISQTPLSDSLFSTYARFGFLQVTMLEINEDMPTPMEQVSEAFGFETMKARHNFKFVQPQTTDDELLQTEKVADGESKG